MKTLNSAIQGYLDTQKDLNKCNSQGVTALMTAVACGHLPVVNALLSLKQSIGTVLVNGVSLDVQTNVVHVNALNNRLENAAHIAYANRDYRILRVLLDNGADIYNRSADGVCVVEELEKEGIDLSNRVLRIEGMSSAEMADCANSVTGTLLQREIKRKMEQSSFVESVLDAGKSSDFSKDSDDWSFLSRVILALAVHRQRLAQTGGNPLHNTVATQLKILLIKAAGREDVNMPNRFGMTPLMMATVCNDIYAVELLLDKGAHINAVNMHLENAGHLAYQNSIVSNDFRILQTLIANGVSMTQRSFMGDCLAEKTDELSNAGLNMVYLRKKNKSALAFRKKDVVWDNFDYTFLSQLILKEKKLMDSVLAKKAKSLA